MPELPEIETVKLQLEKVLVGQVCEEIKILSHKVIKGNFDQILGKRVVSVSRKGKVLLIDFGPDLVLGFHFKMTGQLIYETKTRKLENAKTLDRIVGGHPTEDFVNKMPSNHTRVIFYFDKGTLYFNDQRLFGWIKLMDNGQLAMDDYFKKLGPEPFEMEVGEFIKKLSKLRKPIKVAIMDQEIIAGVGNIYANDALWESRINPRTPVSQLSVAQLHSLFEKVKLVLSEGIKYGGATAADAKYMNLHGLGGHYQEHFRVYDRENLPCKACGTLINKFVLGGRGTYVCPKCQPAEF